MENKRACNCSLLSNYVHIFYIVDSRTETASESLSSRKERTVIFCGGTIRLKVIDKGVEEETTAL